MGYTWDTKLDRYVDDGKRYKKEFDLKPGDRVKIEKSTGWCEGTILEASFWGDMDGWYIELVKDVGNFEMGYGYYKQAYDGGTVKKLGAAPKCPIEGCK
jgi:hypothetical protein